jgi:hypothetical protein
MWKHTPYLFGRQLVKLIEMPPKPAGTRESPTACNDWTNVTFLRGHHGRGKMLFLKMAG